MGIKDRAVIASLKVLPQRYMSHFAGVLASTRLPRPMARAAVRAFGSFYGVNFDEVKEPIESFPSIQSFFTRALKEGARPVDDAADAFVSPCDGAWGSSGEVHDGLALQVKGRSYSVAALLDDPAIAPRFEGGPFATLYLSPRDYHRFHSPWAGEVVSARHVPGALWPVNNAGIVHVDGLFARNERIVALLRPEGHPEALLAMVAVGATMVGKVRVTFDEGLTTNVRPVRGTPALARSYEAPKPLRKGEEWGRFEFGSTLVLVATPGWLALEAAEPGTALVLGRRIGHVGSAGPA
jgi:phosphatidylserine decarboxylase